jgi:hypothetical protein
MIQANELRIGNWVDDSRCFLYKIQKYHFENTDFDITMPIPLTTEILDKCGFVMLHHLGKLQPTLQIDSSLEFHWREGVLFATYTEENCDESIDLGCFIIERPLRQIKYLHQLQNYIYFETGEELNFKP